MLVVTRKVGEKIIIGDRVTVTVVRIAGGMVRIGIEAPKDYSVMRRELLDLPAPSPPGESPS
jgi:carbon storage regulator